MSDYRRVRVPGGCYFFTVNLAERGDNGLLVRHWPVLRAVIAAVRAKRPFRIDAFVVLPDHLHGIWTLPEGDDDIAVRWMLIKTGFSRRLPPGEPRSASRRRRGERGIWQRRFWEHAIRDDHDFAAHVDYVHFNPVRHGYVAEPEAWPYSTFLKMVHRGNIGCC
ncbi:MAG: transposase [Rhodospirillales bacterium]